MIFTYFGIFFLNCLYLAWQDFKDRKVFLWSIITLGAVSMLIGVVYYSEQFLYNFSLNLLIISLVLSFLFLYGSIRFKGKPFFGLGDILCLFCLTPIFNPQQLLLLIITSAITGIILFLLSRIVSVLKRDTIPYVSCLCLAAIGFGLNMVQELW